MTAHKYAIQSLTDAVMSFQLEAIPADVLNLAKRSLIDVCGVTLAGAKTKSAKLSLQNLQHISKFQKSHLLSR